MKPPRENFVHGSSDVGDFIRMMKERHSIYLKRKEGEPAPWTDDPILREYFFTNVYRELDKGTQALRAMCKPYLDMVMDPRGFSGNTIEGVMGYLVFNNYWYRAFNMAPWGKELGFIYEYSKLEEFLLKKRAAGEQMFHKAYMITGSGSWYQPKYIMYMETAKAVFNLRNEIASRLLNMKTLEEAWEYLQSIPLVGPFVAYEYVCDFMYTPLLNHCPDRYTWCNIGPGAVRGLKRLGWPVNMESMQQLLVLVRGDPSFRENVIQKCDHEFAMREVEHSLCEFDKYCRLKDGGKGRRYRANV